MLEAIVQSPQELVFALLTRPQNLDLQILEQVSMDYQGWQIEFAIIGSSHSVRLSCQAFYYQEILACLPLDAQQCHIIAPYSPNYSYQMPRYRMTLATQDEPLFPIPKAASRLSFRFPQVHARDPLTEIIWCLGESQVQWWTLHTYPHAEGEIQVRTYTEFRL